MRSMTGYGAADGARAGLQLTITAHSVNSKRLDLRLHLPRELAFTEPALRKCLQEHLQRGNVKVHADLEMAAEGGRKVRVDPELARAAVRQLRRVQDELGLRGELSVQDLLAVPELITVEQPQLAEETLGAWTRDLLGEALARLVQVREEAGRALQRDLRERLSELQQFVSHIAARAHAVPERYRQRLQQRLQEVAANVQLDPDRLVQEVAYFVERADIAEELTRLQSHFEQLGVLIESDEPVGRQLDFFVQEINREVNTIGSKANDAEISRHVVACKTELERFREQLQNVE